MSKILILIILASALILGACSSGVRFRVFDKQTNEEIKDYKVHVQGHGVDKTVEAGKKVRLSNGMFAPPRYKADVEANGYCKVEDYQLRGRFCFSCFKMFGTEKVQLIYMDQETSSINAELESKQEEVQEFGTAGSQTVYMDRETSSVNAELEAKQEEVQEKVQKEVQEEKPEKKGILFGVRINGGTAEVYPNEIVTTTTNGWGVETSKSSETIDGGYAYGLGAYALIPIWGIYFVPEITIQHREPIKDFDGLTVAETAIDVPLLFRFRYREGNVIYLGIGPYFGVVLDLQDSYDGTFKNHRSKSDIGLTGELGFRINEHFSIDVRMLGSFSSFGFGEYLEIGGETPSLFQSQIGVNYTF